jgi:transcription antitermination factor NusA-like protein
MPARFGSSARSFLASRNSAASEELIAYLAGRKDELLAALLCPEQVETYEGSVRFIEAARKAGLRTAVVSASRHCDNFGYVVGVDRQGKASALRSHGADIVVPDLTALMERM